jgi:RHS repeat-associated protein
MFNCGIRALAHVLTLDGREEEARQLLERQPATLRGDSLADLQTMAAEYGYPLIALRLNVEELAQVSLPAIVQVNGRTTGTGHYWILEEYTTNHLSFLDPQSGTRHQQSQEEFAREWDGVAMTFGEEYWLYANRLSGEEMRTIFGGCCGSPPPPPQPPGDAGDPPEPCPPGDPCCTQPNQGPNSEGAPVMKVNPVGLNLYVKDTPIWYETPIGPDVRVTVSYNSLSSLTQNEPFGNKWQLNYGGYLIVATNGTVTLFMPDGAQRLYNPDGSGGYVKPYRSWDTLVKIAENHFELRRPDGEVWVYNIPAGTASMQPFLVEQRDAHGQSLHFGYNQNIELATITDAQGKVTTLTYNGLGLVETVTDPFGRSAHFEYDILRNLRVITDMGGYVSRLTYDDDVYLTSLGNDRGTWQIKVEPADGLPTDGSRYPAPGANMGANRRITMIDPNGGKIEYYYDAAAYSTWKVTQNNYVEWVGPALNNYTKAAKTTYQLAWMSSATGVKYEIGSITKPDGGVTTYGYNGTTGDRLTERDQLNHTTTYTYNTMGRVTSIKDPKGNLTTLTYATNGVDLEKVSNGLGDILVTYNTAHDITSVTDRLSKRTEYAYNDFGQLTGITDPLNIVTSLEYNSDKQVEQVTRDGQVLTELTYDDKGRVRTGKTATGLLVTLEYNDLNLVTDVTYPDGKAIHTSYAGCCPRLKTSVTDRGDKTTAYEYDAMKRRTSITAPGGEVSRFEYDPEGNVSRFIDPNANVTTFTYDSVGRLTSKKYADNKGVSYVYNKAGLVTQRTDARGTQTSYTYDVNNNLTGINYSDETPDVTLTYDNYNRLLTLKDGSGTTAAGYDANSQLTSLDGPWANDTVSYGFDALGRVAAMQAEGGRSLAYVYDTLNRLTRIREGSEEYIYSYVGISPLENILTRPDGSATKYDYNDLGQLTGISNKDSADTVVSSHGFTYNDQDLRGSESITGAFSAPAATEGIEEYDYNNLNQLLSKIDPNQAFSYDADGNMTRGYTPEGYEFSAAYDAENRLKQIEYTDAAAILHKMVYVYRGDGFLAQISKYSNGTLADTTRIVRGPYLDLQDRGADNSVVNDYLWGMNFGGGIGGLLNLKQGGQSYQYLYDGNGNVTSLLNGSGQIAAAYRYDVFGKLLAQSGSLNQPFQFSTKRYDAGAGLNYYGYRFYAPAIGRWMNRDPLGEAGGINLYGFVSNNPVNWIDPWGLETKPDEQGNANIPQKPQKTVGGADFSYWVSLGVCRS